MNKKNKKNKNQMKTYQDIIAAQNNFYIRRRNYFLDLNYSFFLRLTNEFYEKAELPLDAMIKYKHGTNENINMVEEWTYLDENLICSMRISLKVAEVYHDVNFFTKKIDNNLILKVLIDVDYDEFIFDISNNDVKYLDLDSIIEFVIVTIINVYDQSQP